MCQLCYNKQTNKQTIRHKQENTTMGWWLKSVYCCFLLCLWWPSAQTQHHGVLSRIHHMVKEQLARNVTATSTPTFLVYVVAHDNESMAVAEVFCSNHFWAKPVRINHTTKIFESISFSEIFSFRYNEWKNLDYVGMMSYKVAADAVGKSVSTVGDVSKLIASASSAGYDVIPFVRHQSNMYKEAVTCHRKPFTSAWYALLQELGFSDTLIDHYNQQVVAFYRNSFVCRPVYMKMLSIIMTQAVLLATMNPRLMSMFEVNSNYGGPVDIAMKVFQKNYYELHPFIFERLPVFLLSVMRAKVCISGRNPNAICPTNYMY
jgi:hypothetical protein